MTPLQQDIGLLAPVPADAQRPLWSVMIPTYNCAVYAAETIAGVLQQDPGPEQMQIEVVDDGSNDDIADVVAAIGRGRVGFFRQPRNVGPTANFDTALNRSRGHLIHLLHGDDRVLPGFYRQMGDLLHQFPEAGAAFCRHYFIDDQGHQTYISPLLKKQNGLLPSFNTDIQKGNLLQTPSMVVRRKTYEHSGTFDKRLSSNEDWEMWARIALHHAVAYCTQPLAEYRFYNVSNTVRAIKSGDNLKDMQLVQEIIRQNAQQPGLQRIHRTNLGLTGWLDLIKLYDLHEYDLARTYFYRLLALPIPFHAKRKIVQTFLKRQLIRATHKKSKT